MAKKIRVGLAIADPVIREGRRLLINSQADLDVVYEVESGVDVLNSLGEANVDVLLIDNRVRTLPGAETIARYTRRNLNGETKLPSFVLTGPFQSDDFELVGIRAGASAVVTEEADTDVFLEVLRDATHRDISFEVERLCSFFAQHEIPHGGNPRWLLRLSNLTEDEQSVVDAITSGADGSALKAATKLPQTKVKWALDSLQAKLGLATRAQLALALYEAGLTPARA